MPCALTLAGAFNLKGKSQTQTTALPAPWQMVIPTDGGDTFYINGVTGESRMQPPKVVAVPQAEVITHLTTVMMHGVAWSI